LEYDEMTSSVTESQPVDARMRRTRKALHAALLVLLEQKRFDQITIRDIAAQADIGYATFFRHHASKSALLEEVAAREIGHLMALTHPLLDACDTRVACLALCRYVGVHRVLWTALLTGAGDAMREELIRLATQEAATLGRTCSWLPVELGAVYGVTATVEILTWWLRRYNEFTPEQMAEIVDRLVVAPTIGGA
jgi:AcrR family transcriptional regulator